MQAECAMSKIASLDISTIDKSSSIADILVVDDSEMIVKTASLLLEEEGYSVRTAYNGKEALDRVYSRMPDVILLDLMMPCMDGWEFVSLLRKLPNGYKPKILILSAVYGLSIDDVGTNADGWLGKPFSVEDLLGKVSDVLRKQYLAIGA